MLKLTTCSGLRIDILGKSSLIVAVFFVATFGLIPSPQVCHVGVMSCGPRHVMYQGRILKSGGKELADKLDEAQPRLSLVLYLFYSRVRPLDVIECFVNAAAVALAALVPTPIPVGAATLVAVVVVVVVIVIVVVIVAGAAAVVLVVVLVLVVVILCISMILCIYSTLYS